MPKRKLAKEPIPEDNDATPEVTTNGHANAPVKKKRRVSNVKDEIDIIKEEIEAPTPKKKKKQKQKYNKEVEQHDEEASEQAEANGEVKTKKKHKPKTKKAAEAMPVAIRTKGHKLFIGAHVSSAGGVDNSVVNSVRIGANAFALFLKSQRKWANPPLADEALKSFHANCKSHSYNQSKHVVPHGSYLVNLAHTDKARTEQAYGAFLDDLKRCEKLGIGLYNFHPGVANSTNGDRQAAIAHLASNINRAHKDTSSVVTLLENMAAGGNVLGSTFEDLRDTIALINNKDRVGVCLDTCHAFAAGYDLRSPEAFKTTMDEFEKVVGFKYLRALHMNDSKAPFASHRDLHANIGTGFLGLRAFHNIINEPRLEGLPMILETPLEAKDEVGTLLKDDKGKPMEDKGMWAREIKLLESLYGADMESADFLKLEKELATKGESERKKHAEQMEKKLEKEEKKGKKVRKRGGKKSKKVKESEEEEMSFSELENGDEADGAGDTQRLAE